MSNNADNLLGGGWSGSALGKSTAPKLSASVDGIAGITVTATTEVTTDQYEAFTVLAGQTPSALVFQDSERSSMKVRNNAVDPVYVGKMGQLTTGQRTGYLLPAGAELSVETTGAVYAVCANPATTTPAQLSVWVERA